MTLRTPSQSFNPALEARARVAAIRADLPKGGLRATVIGAGKSGRAAVELLEAHRAVVTVMDDKLTELDGRPVKKIDERALDDAELVVLSPGVPRSRPELQASVLRGILVGEIELASWFIKAPIIGITGTNGKSTTTALVAHICEVAGKRTFAGGNLGEPLAKLAVSKDQVDVAVVELSSYQLESIVDATFEVACWLNLTPDHADRYPDLLTYASAKRRIIERRSINGVAVLNAKDRFCSDMGIRIGGPIRWFAADVASDLAGPMGTLLTGPDSAVRTVDGVEEHYSLANPALPGRHNRANMCAAIECVRHMELAPAAVQAGLLSFNGLPHRIELVGTIDGVRYYNDSKATNVDSAVIALRALASPKILIAGGKDKGAPWAPLREAAETSGVKAVLAIGKTPELVLQAFRGAVAIVEDLGTLERALDRARALAKPGDAVLLSPACASFDQFDNYEHRGDTFRKLVAGLGGGR